MGEKDGNGGGGEVDGVRFRACVVSAWLRLSGVFIVAVVVDLVGVRGTVRHGEEPRELEIEGERRLSFLAGSSAAVGALARFVLVVVALTPFNQGSVRVMLSYQKTKAVR